MAKQKYKFERLTPIDNMDLDVYEEAIDYVFSNSDVKNVAISGAYSAGKSSVLASYKKKHDELRFLHISLAHFKSTDQESDAEVKESTLEGKILNQLILCFNKYITPLLKYNEVQFVHCAYYGSDDAKKWPNKLAVLTDDEFEHNEQGIPKWFNINYEDVDGNEMYQTFELKDFDGTPYYSLESINDI